MDGAERVEPFERPPAPVRDRPTPPPVVVTPILLALNVAWFVWMAWNGVSAMNPTSEQLLAFGGNLGALVVAGQWWRMLTAAFVHVGFIHLAVNCYALWVLGPTVERLYGRVAYLALYLLGAIGCSLASLVAHPASPSAGASGAISAVAGAMLAFVLLHRRAMTPDSFRGSLRAMGSIVVANVIIGLAVPNIDLAGHGGGFFTGIAAGWALDRGAWNERVPAGKRLARTLVVLAALGGCAAYTFHYVRSSPDVAVREALRSIDRALASGRQAYEAGDHALADREWKRAEREASALLDDNPRDETALELRAHARAMLDDVDGALADCDALIALDPDDPNANGMYLRAQIRLALGEFAAASKDLEWLAENARGAAQHHELLGQARLGQRDWTGAERAFEASLRVSSKNAHAELGAWIARQFTPQRALADKQLNDFLSSIRSSELDQDESFLLSVALGDEGQSALTTPKPALFARVGIMRALRRVRTGNFDEARREAEQVIAQRPKSWEASVARAIVEQLKR